MGTRTAGDFLKGEAVLITSTILALLSMIAIPPDRLYLAYIDWQTLALLFALMLVVAGLSEHRVLDTIACTLIARSHTTRGRALALVALTFFASMFITNDVALITFVPLTIIVFTVGSDDTYLLYTIVLQTIAANVGSALTPVGNPQNLFLYNYYGLTAITMAKAMAPYVGGGALLLVLLHLYVPKNKDMAHIPHDREYHLNIRSVVRYIGLFLFALLTVFHVVSVPIGVFIIVLGCEKRLLKEVDYSLLATFVSLFILVGNLGRLKSIQAIIHSSMEGREFYISLALSQLVSNVPATLLLAQFTDNALELLRGVNAGGCGTLIASMASVISFRLFVKHKPTQAVIYLALFTLINIIFVALFIAIHLIV